MTVCQVSEIPYLNDLTFQLGIISLQLFSLRVINRINWDNILKHFGNKNQINARKRNNPKEGSKTLENFL